MPQVFVLPRDHPNFFDWRTIAGTIFADKSSYIEDLEKGAPNYRYVFLRPRRFGKSAFLNMLCAYYDIHKANIFDDLFGPLYIGKNPTASKNTHLVLKFDLSSISVSGSVDEMKTSFNDYINDVLRQFLKKYSSELGYPEESTTINNFSATQSLRRILVSYYSYSLVHVITDNRLKWLMSIYSAVFGWDMGSEHLCRS
jgi:hypothetical protein